MFKSKNKVIEKSVPGFVIPRELVVHGNIESPVSGRIEGTVEGNIVSRDKLVIGEAGIVKGDIDGNEIVVQGKVFGNVNCLQNALICKTAWIEGTVNAAFLEVEENATILNNASTNKSSRKKAEVPENFVITAIIGPAKVTENEHTWF